MKDNPIKIGDLYYQVGQGPFGCSITKYKEISRDDEDIKLERINEGDDFFIYRKTRIECYEHLVDLWRKNELS